jgi:hypothetical protein
MGDPVFIDGIPAPITGQEFLRYHLQQFPRLSNPANAEVLEEAISTVYTIFTGVSTLWDLHPQAVYYEKTVTCYRLLVAWYIADTRPMFLSGTPMMGGVPLKRKKIGDVDITFADSAVSQADGSYKDLLSSLKSNPFGHKAYLMITSSGKRVMLRGATSV